MGPEVVKSLLHDAEKRGLVLYLCPTWELTEDGRIILFARKRLTEYHASHGIKNLSTHKFESTYVNTCVYEGYFKKEGYDVTTTSGEYYVLV